VISWGCVALAVCTYFTSISGKHDPTGEQFTGFTGPLALAANVSALAFAFARRREAPAA
jgi:hypothetical protein